LPLADLLGHAAAALEGVRAGRSLTDLLATVPAAARPGTQALSFHALRWCGGATAVRQRLAPRTPPAPVAALLDLCIALTWPEASAPYAPHTLVDQAVACARRRHPASAGFVNAVLRRWGREQAALVAAVQAADPVARHQHPVWWLDRLKADWPQDWAALLAADQAAPPMVLRVNARQTDVAGYLAELAAVGLGARAVGPAAPQALVLDEPVPVQRLPGFDQGRVSVQDLAAQLAAPLLVGEGADRLRPGARVLDACAAPGGKTAHLLELADLEVLALDQDAGRLARVDDTLRRCGLSATTRAADARRPADWWDGRLFDAILLDAPCSASGIVRRHPDIRWLRRAEDIPALAAVQRELLDALWPLLAPGGRLVYATCSLFRAEGADQVAAFAQRTPGVQPRPSPGHLAPLADNPVTGAEPDAVRPDGFFYARFDKP
jgi:16S rRNA (cytosine967-C5)-methyltransferase